VTKHKPYPLTDQQLQSLICGDFKSFGLTTFPVEFPVSFDNVKLGTIRIEFDLKTENISKEKRFKKMILLSTFLKQFNAIKIIFEKSVNLSLNIWDKYEKEKNYLDRLISLSKFAPVVRRGDHSEPLTDLETFFFVKEDKIFELISQEGPIALCNPFVQDLISEWLLDNKRSEGRMTKLRMSLLDYASNSDRSNKKSIKPGPKEETKTGIIKILDEERIKDIHNELRIILKEVKANKKVFEDDIIEFFDRSYRDPLYSLKEELEKSQNPKDKRAYKIIKNECEKLEYAKNFKYYYFISETIESNEELKTEFEKFKWEPNKMAKKIMAKILGPGFDSMVRKLYSK